LLPSKAGLTTISNWTYLNLSNTKIASSTCELSPLLIQRIASVREQFGPSAVKMSAIWGSLTLPTDLSVLSHMTRLDLQGIDALDFDLNQMLQELTNLTYLNLADCLRLRRVQLSIQSIIAISKIREANGSSAVDLHNCGPFTLPDDVGSECGEFTTIDLSSIRFKGVNIKWFAQCTGLQSLNLSHTKWKNAMYEWCGGAPFFGVYGNAGKLGSKLPKLKQLLLEDSLVTGVSLWGSDYFKYPSSHQATTSFSTFVTAVLAQVHPDSKMSTHGMQVMCDLLALTLGRLASLSVDLGEREANGSAVRVDDRAVVSAMALIMSGTELAKHSLSEMTKAVVKYDESEDKSDLPTASGLAAGAKVFGAVCREMSWYALTDNCTPNPKAVVKAVAVVEYVCAEVLELAGNAARDVRSDVIDPWHIALAIHGDQELDKLFSSTHTGCLRMGTFMFRDRIPNVSIGALAS
jgi:histone H2A